MTEIINDVVALPVYEDPIDNMKSEQFITVTERPIGTTTGLNWTLRLYKMPTCCCIRVCLWVSGPIRASATISWGYRSNGSKNFLSAQLPKGETAIAENIDTRDVGQNGFVKCEVEFTPINTCVKLPMANIHQFFNDATHCGSDIEIVVGDDRLKVHRSMLSLMSPVFQSYFEHDTKESQTGVIDITDFDFNTVQNVIDYAYGRDIEPKSITEITDMLRFADKYDIKTILKLENVLQSNLNLESFCNVAQFAWDLEKQELQTTCAQYFRKHSQHLTFSQDFVQLAPEVLKGIISAAALQPV
uniref:BTB domain-containing protein n=1 Tax=Panagrellus redivivus TaxID=6233 RepID=A0A7E4ZXD7_PANRE